MRNEIFKQIEKNRSSYYSQLNNLKNENVEVIKKPDINTGKEIQKETTKAISSFTILLNILSQKLSGINLPQIRSSKFAQQSKEVLKKQTSGISQFAKKINQNLTQKTDALIERFYHLGSRIFEDNTESSQSYAAHLETIPVSAFQNNDSAIMNLQLFVGNKSSLFNLSGIIESFKTIQKNILIYLESDTFTFSQLKSNTDPKPKEISYEEKTENIIINEESLLNMAKFKLAKKSKVLTPVNSLLRKVSEKYKLNFFTFSQRFSNFQLNRLFPILNRFI